MAKLTISATTIFFLILIGCKEDYKLDLDGVVILLDI